MKYRIVQTENGRFFPQYKNSLLGYWRGFNLDINNANSGHKSFETGQEALTFIYRDRDARRERKEQTEREKRGLRPYLIIPVEE